MELDFTQLKLFSGRQQTAGATLLTPSAGQKVYVAFASVTRNSGASNHVDLNFGARTALSTTGPNVGGPFVGEPGEALATVIGATTTGDWVVSAMLIGARANRP